MAKKRNKTDLLKLKDKSIRQIREKAKKHEKSSFYFKMNFSWPRNSIEKNNHMMAMIPLLITWKVGKCLIQNRNLGLLLKISNTWLQGQREVKLDQISLYWKEVVATVIIIISVTI